jgi:hypothetical protein
LFKPPPRSAGKPECYGSEPQKSSQWPLFRFVAGLTVAGLTGISFLFWIVSIFVFICSLPFTLVDGYIQSKIDYVQDREDYRETMREIAEEERMDI